MSGKKKEIKMPEGMKTILDILIESYNQELENVVRLTTDAEYLQYLVIAEPREPEHVETKANIDKALRNKKKVLQILEKRIIKHMEGEAENG